MKRTFENLSIIAEDGTVVPLRVETTNIDETRDELELAFSGIRNPNDWRDPIDSIIDVEDRDVVQSAIVFFTATDPKFSTLPDGRLRVTAAGYRAGIAGDH